LTGQLALERPVFQFTALAAKKSEAKTVSETLKKILADFQGTIGGVAIQKIELQNEASSLVESSDGTLKVYAEDLEFEFNYVKED
jgi:hypothetical protein